MSKVHVALFWNVSRRKTKFCAEKIESPESRMSRCRISVQNIEVTALVWYYFFSPEIWPISVPPVARCRCKVKNDSESQNLSNWCYSLSELPNDSPQNNHNRIGLALEKIEDLKFFLEGKFSKFLPWVLHKQSVMSRGRVPPPPPPGFGDEDYYRLYGRPEVRILIDSQPVFFEGIWSLFFVNQYLWTNVHSK